VNVVEMKCCEVVDGCAIEGTQGVVFGSAAASEATAQATGADRSRACVSWARRSTARRGA
jgi:hypothetical protein